MLFGSDINQITGGWCFAPDSIGGAYSTSPDTIAVIRGPTSKRKREKGGRKGKEKGGRKGRSGRAPRG